MADIRARFLWCVLVTVPLTLAQAATLVRQDESGPQHPSGTVNFNIDAQSIAQALKQFAAQANIQLIYETEDINPSLTTEGLIGSFTPEAGLSKLLARTNLRYQFVNERTVSIRYTESTNAPAPEVSSKKSSKPQSVGSMGKGPDAEPEEVIVTAQKRTERLREVPISIAVLRGDDLDKSTAQGVSDELGRTPGVATSLNVQGGGTQVTIRGVTASDALFTGSSPIAYYLDSVPFGLVKTAIAPDSNAFDLERVEVLRGPQGTLYGASALNGVVRVLTKDADLDHFEFKARVADSGTANGGNNYRGDAAVNIPIIDGKLAARAVVGYDNWSGWIDSSTQKDANTAELRNYRLKIDARPTDELSIGLSAWRSRDDYGAPSTSGDGLHASSVVLAQPITTDFDAYGAKIVYDLPQVSISSMTSYLRYDNGGYLDLTPFGLNDDRLFTGLNSKVISEELLLNSPQLGDWRWTAGAFYRDAKDRLNQRAGYLPAPIDYSDDSESYALFGEINRRFLTQFEWTLGVRYYHEDVSNRENVQDQGLPNVPLYHASASASATTPRAVLTWRPNPNLDVYASYSQGFRGGFPQNAKIVQSAPGFPPLRPDKLRNFELGAKTALLDNRVFIDTALYYIKWTGVQQILRVDVNGVPASAPVNGGDSSGLGLDLAITARPTDGLELGVSGSWNNLSWDKNTFFDGTLLFSKGDRLNYSPEYTAGPFVNYTLHLGGSGLDGHFSASATYTSKQFLSDYSGGTRTLETGDNLLVARTSFGLSWNDTWTATVFADNVTNERGTAVRDAYGVPDWSPRMRPRTIGLQLDYQFK